MIGYLWRPFIIGRNVPPLEYVYLDSVHTHTHVYPTKSMHSHGFVPDELVCPQALVIAGISLQTANLYGYIHCKLGGQKTISRVTSRLFGTADVPKSEYWASAHGMAQPPVSQGCCWLFPALFLQWIQGDPDCPASLSGSGTWKSCKVTLLYVWKPAELHNWAASKLQKNVLPLNPCSFYNSNASV